MYIKGITPSKTKKVKKLVIITVVSFALFTFYGSHGITHACLFLKLFVS
jgi:hypothetical protein